VGSLDAVVEELDEHPTADVVILQLGFDIILGKWKPIGAFDPPISPEDYEVWEQAVWDEAMYGADGEHGLKLIVDTILAVRPDVKLLYSSYDYIGWLESDWDMDTVHRYNVGMERFFGAVIDFVAANYSSPPRVFVVNNLGLMQYTFGYPGPDPGSIPDYFWPVPGTPHDFRFDPGPAPAPGDPPLYPGNEASGYEPLAGGAPEFRISPYAGQMDPPVSGWVHLSIDGYTTVAEHCIDEYIADWLDWPKVYAVQRSTMHPLNPLEILDPTGEPQVSFQVSFSEPVTGVDELDFEPLMHQGLANASIEDVIAGKQATTYTVLVNTGAGNGALGLAVIDNESIMDLAGNPLGGPGPNNGDFAYGTPYHIDREVGLPLATWPVAAAMLALAAYLLRRP